jgi:FAD/FMN-containing dehydrogenase
MVASFTANVADLRGACRGEVLLPETEGYDQSRRVFNAMIDRRPALIVRAVDAGDATRAVRFARGRGLVLSIKGGGHSVAGNAVCDGGLMLDMSRMNNVSVDPARRIAIAEAGVTLGAFDAATAEHGLATTLGVVSLTGLAGLTLGGGIGWLNGKYGLSCDNVLSVDIVTADGQLRTANAEQNQDLFWAVRGGGGNFGVVVTFTLALHPVRTVLAGGMSFPPGEAATALSRYHEFAAAAPDELSTAASVSCNAAGQPVVSVGVCWCGPPEQGEQVLRPLREFTPTARYDVRLMPYVTLQSASDGGFPSGRQHYWKASFLKDLSAGAIDVMLRLAAEAPSPFTGVGLQELTGAASRVDPAATAFAHRGRRYDFLILSQWENPADSARNIAWSRAFFAAMRPYLDSGVYMNNLGEEGHDRVRDAYGGNYERLARVKATYDPTNLFSLNPNVQPAEADVSP